MKGKLTAASALCLFLALSCSRPGRYPVTVRRISDRMIVLSCMKVNVTAIRTDRGLIIIDTNRSPKIMSEVMRRIEKELQTDRVLYVINTHGDRDHVSGNQIFSDSIIVGQENAPEYMRQTSRLTADADDQYVLTPPSRTFRDSLTLDAGSMKIYLYYAGNAHANNDIFIFVPSEKALLVGDLFSRNSLSFKVNRLNDVPRIAGLLEKFIKDGENIKVVIPGHGDEMLTLQDLVDVRKLIEDEYEGLEKKSSAALTLSELVGNNDAGAALKKYTSYRRRADYYFQEDEFRLAGKHFLWKGELDKAVAVFQIAVWQYPVSVLALDDLADAFLRRGDADSAAVFYERSLKIFPNNLNAREILKKLRSSR